MENSIADIFGLIADVFELLVVLLALNIVLSFNHNKKLKKMDEKFSSILKRIDDATNGIAAELRDLQTKLTGVGLTTDQENEVLASLESAAQKLEGIGAVPEDAPPPAGS